MSERSYNVTTSTGISHQGFKNEYETFGRADELDKKAGELGVAYTITVTRWEDGERTVIRIYERSGAKV